MDHSVTVLEALRERGRASRTELAAATGLSAATVSRAVSKLRRDGVVRERPGEAAIGRPPSVVELRRGAAYVLGIDAGGSRIRVVLTDLEGAVCASTTASVERPHDHRAVLRTIQRTAASAASRAAGGQVLAAAAGISGIVDRSIGKVLISPDLPTLQGQDMSERLSRLLGVPTAIDNDDLLAAVGEAAFGSARGCTDVVFLSLGYGLGAGLIVGGRPVRGAGSAAGAIAYFAPGRLEYRASGRVVPRRYADRLQRRKAGDATAMLAHVDAEDVFRRAAGGDGVANAVVHDVIEALGDAVVNVAALLDPEVIVLGGGLVHGSPDLFQRLTQRLRSAVPYPPRLAPSALGDDAVARGAAVLALTLAKQRLAGGDGEPALTPDPARIGALLL